MPPSPFANKLISSTDRILYRFLGNLPFSLTFRSSNTETPPTPAITQWLSTPWVPELFCSVHMVFFFCACLQFFFSRFILIATCIRTCFESWVIVHCMTPHSHHALIWDDRGHELPPSFGPCKLDCCDQCTINHCIATLPLIKYLKSWVLVTVLLRFEATLTFSIAAVHSAPVAPPS